MKERGRGAVAGVEHSPMEPKQPRQAASIRDRFGRISVLRQTLTLVPAAGCVLGCPCPSPGSTALGRLCLLSDFLHSFPHSFPHLCPCHSLGAVCHDPSNALVPSTRCFPFSLPSFGIANVHRDDLSHREKARVRNKLEEQQC